MLPIPGTARDSVPSRSGCESGGCPHMCPTRIGWSLSRAECQNSKSTALWISYPLVSADKSHKVETEDCSCCSCKEMDFRRDRFSTDHQETPTYSLPSNGKERPLKYFGENPGG